MAPDSSTQAVDVTGHAEQAMGQIIGFQTLVLATLSGVVTALLGYLAIYAMLASRAMEVLGRHGPQYSIARDVLPQFSGSIPVWKAVGWLYYNAHWAGVKFQEVGQQGGNFLNFLAYEGGVYAWLWLLPAALTVMAGALIASRAGGQSLRESALAGATVTVGYGLVLLAGTAVFAVEVGGVYVSPELTFVALLGFPAVFGALGGIVTGLRHRWENSTELVSHEDRR